MRTLLLVAIFLINTHKLIAQETTSDSYVGSSVCGTCHKAETKAWRGSHHDQAMQAATADTVLGDFSGVTQSNNGKETRFFMQTGSYWINTEGPDGKQQDHMVLHTFGVTPLQQYLIELPGGKLQALPWAWDSRPTAQGGQRWYHLYASDNVMLHDRLHWTQPLANWNGMCADCHTTGLKRNLNITDLTFATTFQEENVACEACHGPGASHVEQTKNGDDGKNDFSIILSYLEKHKDGAFDLKDGETTAKWAGPPRSTLELNTCANCHSRRAPLNDGFKAGDHFMDNFSPALIEPGLYHPDGQIMDEVYVWGSFLQSKMHGKHVTCSDCHDPHSLKPKFEGNKVCTQCHLSESFDTKDHHNHQQDTPGAECANCHMPETTFMGIDPRHDHSIRIPRPDISTVLGTPNACNSCHSEKSADWAASAIEGWSGSPKSSHHKLMAESLAAAWQGDRRALSNLKLLAGKKSLPAIVRASAYAAMQGLTGAEDANDLMVGLRDTDPLVRMGAIRGAAALPAQVRQQLLAPRLNDERRANRIEAVRHLLDLPISAFSQPQKVTRTKAERELVASEQQKLWRGEGGLNLAQFLEAKGNFTAARSTYEKTIKADPYFAPARINLAEHHRQAGRTAQERAILETGLKLTPRDADLNHAYGLLFVRARQYQAALPHLETASFEAPTNARYSYVYATALISLGNREGALKVYETTLNRAPNDVDTLYALAIFYAQSGQRVKALGFAQRLQILLPGEPAVLQLIRQLQ